MRQNVFICGGAYPQAARARASGAPLSTLGCGASELACSAVVWSVAEVWDRRGAVKGPTMVYEPSDLRFFQARFEPVG